MLGFASSGPRRTGFHTSPAAMHAHLLRFKPAAAQKIRLRIFAGSGQATPRSPPRHQPIALNSLGGRTTVTVQGALATTSPETLPRMLRSAEFVRAPSTMWSTWFARA